MYSHQWWNNPLDPYKDDRIYLSDGNYTSSWFYKEQGGDPSKVITYEAWLLVPKPEHKILPLPFVMSNASERASQVSDRENDRHIHFGK